MRIITYVTSSQQYYPSLIESSKKFNYDIITLGMGEKWKNFREKNIRILNYLQQEKNKEEIIIISDGYDVLLVKDSKNILDTFKKNYSEEDILFNSEALSNSYIINREWKKIFEPKILNKNKYKILNAGLYIGKIKNIISMLEAYLGENIEDDQKGFNKLYKKNLLNITIDYKCLIFTAISTLNYDLVIKDKKIYNNYTKTYPFAIHGPGSYIRLEPYIKILNLKSGYKKSKLKENYYIFYVIV